jgi:hypothetical protein
MTREMILGIVRHILTLVGGGFVAKGHIDASTAETVVGALISLSGVAWSILEKNNRK